MYTTKNHHITTLVGSIYVSHRNELFVVSNIIFDFC